MGLDYVYEIAKSNETKTEAYYCRKNPMSKIAMPPKGTTRKYRWDEWEDGKVHQAKAGKDFHIGVDSFRNTLTRRANIIGRRVETRVRGDVVTFRFIDQPAGRANSSGKQRRKSRKGAA